eukprot:GILI01002860.1.p1 GENE.GILI01002860.1~~GILI01002860.1.p1  ORF type:complete len:211 (+),score=50.64 GILI01002860.1:196-828(+)
MPLIKSIKKFFSDNPDDAAKKISAQAHHHERTSSGSHSYAPTPIESPTARNAPGGITHKGAKKAEHHPAKKTISPSHSHQRHHSSPSSRLPPSSRRSSPPPELAAPSPAADKAGLSISSDNAEDGMPSYRELTMPLYVADESTPEERNTRFNELRRARSVNFPLASLLSPNGERHVRQDTDLFSPVTPQRSDTFHDKRFHLSMKDSFRDR